MERILTANEMQAADRAAQETYGIPQAVLMERAALALADAVCAHRGDMSSGVFFFCGRGNNGADGVAAARILLERGIRAHVYVLEGKIPENSLLARQMHIFAQEGGKTELFDPESFRPYGARVVVDAILGVGAKPPLRADAADMARAVKSCRDIGAIVIAADLPTGVSGDDGSVDKEAVRADETVSFGFRKRSSVLFPGALYCGQVSCDPVGIPEAAWKMCRDAPETVWFTLSRDDLDKLPPRSPAGHKGTFGRVLVVAGSKGMTGASVLCASGVLRSGAGMVRVFTEASCENVIHTALPEALVTTYNRNEPVNGDPEKVNGDPETTNESAGTVYAGTEKSAGSPQSLLSGAFRWCSGVVAGPGLGTDDTAFRIVRLLVEASCADGETRPFVFDADALNLLAAHPELMDTLGKRRNSAPVILTPHPAEFARLCGITVDMARKEREARGRALARRLRCILVLKDARTLVIGENDARIEVDAAASMDEGVLPAGGVFVNERGSDALATAGSGDVLSGILGAVLQRFPENPFGAVCLGVLVHALAGEEAAKRLGKSGVTASALPAEAGRILG